MYRAKTTGWLGRWLCATAGLLPLAAGASAVTSIEVRGLQVAVIALSTGQAPAVSFAGAGGSSADSEVSIGNWSAGDSSAPGASGAFGPVASFMSVCRSVGAAASMTGDAFGTGATVRASAFASGNGADALGQGTVGLVDGLSSASFTLAPWTRMTITATVLATASVSGSSPFDYADSGLSMTLSDSDGLGLQFTRFTADAFASGAFGAFDDVETWSVALGYENDSDADLTGLFSGYVASLASASAVPEPDGATSLGAGLLLLAGLMRVGATRARRERAMKKAGMCRPGSGVVGAARAPRISLPKCR